MDKLIENYNSTDPNKTCLVVMTSSSYPWPTLMATPTPGHGTGTDCGGRIGDDTAADTELILIETSQSTSTEDVATPVPVVIFTVGPELFLRLNLRLFRGEYRS